MLSGWPKGLHALPTSVKEANIKLYHFLKGSIGSALYWYHEGCGFESQQERGNITEFELIGHHYK